MKLVGYRPLHTLLVNCKNQLSGSGKIICCGNAVCDIHKNAEINLREDLIIGANLRKGSRSESYLKIKNNGMLKINGRFQIFFGASLEIFENAELTLGRGYINTGGAVVCAKSITMGDGVFIGRNTYITDSDHHQILDNDGNVINGAESVHIGNHVLIGFGAVVLKGVTIGDNTIVAAGSVVTHSIPSGCIAAGIPAKIIKEGIDWR